MKTILLKFSGPIQSWGTNSRFETRHTDYYPSKSAVIGMISAALGYKRDDQRIEKLNELDFAVRIDQEGKLAKDYHIAQKFKDNGDFDRTYVTNRYYLEDGVFVVGLSHENDEYIGKIEKALRYPYFQLFMGRRAFPISPDFIIEIKEETLLESLTKLPWQAMKWYKKKSSSKINLSIYADGDLVKDGKKHTRLDKVISFSQKERKFGPRYETRINISIDNNNETEHDAFSALGE